MKYALRAVVSALLLVGVYAVAVVLALAVLAGVAVALGAGGAWAVGAGVVVVASLVAAGVVGLTGRRQRRTRRVIHGVSIATEEQPLLWVEVYRVAEGLVARPPDELVLVPDASVAITEKRTWLGLRPGVRRLYLGLPLLAGLTERQLRALMAHELSRFSAATPLERVIYRGQQIIGRVVDRLGDKSLAGRVVGRYGRAYLAVSRPVIRSFELEADRISADLAGNGATSSALRECAVLSRGWDAFADGYAAPAVAAGRRPQDLFAGFSCFLEQPGRREQLADAAEAGSSADEREAPGRSAYDSLPSLADRLAAIGKFPEDELFDKSGPCLGMLRNPDGVIHLVEASMFNDSGVVAAAWEDIVPEAEVDAAFADARELRRLAHEGGLGPTLSVATMLELLRHGLVDEMVRPLLTEGASGDVERQMAVRLVTGFFATAAIESGTASYRFSWEAPRQLVDDQGVADDLPRLVVTALADGTKVSALELWLTAHHVGQELELGEDHGSERDDPPGGATEDPAESPAGRHTETAAKHVASGRPAAV